MERIAGSFAPGASDRNIVGYSYGSVAGAQAALELSRQGVSVENLVLVGAPIAPESDLARVLETDPNIGRVIWIDIPGDPLSGGIDPSRVGDVSRHFAFIEGAPGGGASFEQMELAGFISEVMARGPETGRYSLPTSMHNEAGEFYRVQEFLESRP
jgi:pimeloyl-ACP methyl ester carboxylesterase